jgi:uncharacterized membrane protein YfhO
MHDGRVGWRRLNIYYIPLSILFIKFFFFFFLILRLLVLFFPNQEVEEKFFGHVLKSSVSVPIQIVIL